MLLSCTKCIHFNPKINSCKLFVHAGVEEDVKRVRQDYKKCGLYAKFFRENKIKCKPTISLYCL